MMTRIIIAAVLLVILHFIPITGIPIFICYLAIYLEIGYDILKKAFKGIKNGQDIISCPDRRSCAYKSAVCSDFSGIVRRIFSTRFLSIFFTKKVNPSFVVITSPSFGK